MNKKFILATILLIFSIGVLIFRKKKNKTNKIQKIHKNEKLIYSILLIRHG